MDRRRGFGLYVHWPFCQAKCPYCDFNSHVSSTIDHAVWRDALVSEIRRAATETGSRVLDSIFFGGGTPSLMSPETVSDVIDTAREVWAPSNEIEITLEANPTSVEASRFRAFADAGVNRVSIGVQSLIDEDLRALGRLHSANEACAAVKIAQEIFDRVSFDLIYGRQNQSVQGWREELSAALRMGADHLSLYQLTIEDNTAFGDRLKRGKLRGLPDEDLGADLYDVTQELTARAGYRSYEVSNHSRPGQESRHNMIYWRSGDWVGIGPGAHGRLTLAGERIATESHLQPKTWLESVSALGSGESIRSVLSGQERTEETLIMGLRLNEGVVLGAWSDEKSKEISRLSEIGLIETSRGALRTTRSGRLVLNHVLRTLLD
ncbi:MAG: coproporphyrinogen III oxidase [Silicimonas sp.]|nr:coproporphyrinogen III oxidase [Silicimonas sp.]